MVKSIKKEGIEMDIHEEIIKLTKEVAKLNKILKNGSRYEKNIDGITKRRIVYKEKEYDVDVLLAERERLKTNLYKKKNR